MKRNYAILAGAFVCIALLLASAVLTYQHRRAAIASQPVHIDLGAPDGDKTAAAAPGGMPDGSPDFRGKQAPDFTLQTLDGKQVRLKDLRGKAVLVNFWATWCAPCKIEIPWFIKLYQQYQPQGFEILGVDAEDIPQAEAQKAAKALNINYPVLLRGDKIGDQWGGLDGLPTSFYIDRNGKIVDQTVGLYSRDEVEHNIEKILGAPGTAQPAGQTRAAVR